SGATSAAPPCACGIAPQLAPMLSLELSQRVPLHQAAQARVQNVSRRRLGTGSVALPVRTHNRGGGNMHSSERGGRRRRLTSAHVIAFIALFIALAGGAYAVTKAPKDSVNSKSIVNESILGKDVKNGTLDGNDVRDNSLGG